MSTFVPVQPSTLDFIISPYHQAGPENLRLSFDVARWLDLASNEVPLNPVLTLRNLTTGRNYPEGLDGSPVILGTVIKQIVVALSQGHVYALIVEFDTSVHAQHYAPRLVIKVDY